MLCSDSSLRWVGDSTGGSSVKSCEWWSKTNSSNTHSTLNKWDYDSSWRFVITSELLCRHHQTISRKSLKTTFVQPDEYDNRLVKLRKYDQTSTRLRASSFMANNCLAIKGIIIHQSLTYKVSAGPNKAPGMSTSLDSPPSPFESEIFTEAVTWMNSKSDQTTHINVSHKWSREATLSHNAVTAFIPFCGKWKWHQNWARRANESHHYYK